MNVIDWVNMFCSGGERRERRRWSRRDGANQRRVRHRACGTVKHYDHFIESVGPDIYTRFAFHGGEALLARCIR